MWGAVNVEYFFLPENWRLPYCFWKIACVLTQEVMTVLAPVLNRFVGITIYAAKNMRWSATLGKTGMCIWEWVTVLWMSTYFACWRHNSHSLESKVWVVIGLSKTGMTPDVISKFFLLLISCAVAFMSIATSAPAHSPFLLPGTLPHSYHPPPTIYPLC